MDFIVPIVVVAVVAVVAWSQRKKLKAVFTKVKDKVSGSDSAE